MSSPRGLWMVPAWVAFLLAPAYLVGCGGDSKEGTIQMSPEAKKADEGAQKGMMEFMQSKKAGKAKPR